VSARGNGGLVELSAADIVTAIQAVRYELVLLAAVGIALLGIEDVAFDWLWLVRRRPDPLPEQPPLTGPLAIFVPAWRESAVLDGTIAGMLHAWRDEDVRIYIGCYPNDPHSIFAISRAVAAEPRLRLVIGRRDGPTSKADNLNTIWHAMGADERADGIAFAAVVLHDAEDHVHGEEIALFRRTLPGAAMVRPIMPMNLPRRMERNCRCARRWRRGSRRRAPGAPFPGSR
jgi:bacteriophage N4 adsorption protein B